MQFCERVLMNHKSATMVLTSTLKASDLASMWSFEHQRLLLQQELLRRLQEEQRRNAGIRPTSVSAQLQQQLELNTQLRRLNAETRLGLPSASVPYVTEAHLGQPALPSHPVQQALSLDAVSSQLLQQSRLHQEEEAMKVLLRDLQDGVQREQPRQLELTAFIHPNLGVLGHRNQMPASALPNAPVAPFASVDPFARARTLFQPISRLDGSAQEAAVPASMKVPARLDPLSHAEPVAYVASASAPLHASGDGGRQSSVGATLTRFDPDPEMEKKPRAMNALATNRKPRKKNSKWLATLEELKKYKEEHGDCIVPRGYSLNPKLASWVAEQRCVISELHPSLT